MREVVGWQLLCIGQHRIGQSAVIHDGLARDLKDSRRRDNARTNVAEPISEIARLNVLSASG